MAPWATSKLALRVLDRSPSRGATMASRGEMSALTPLRGYETRLRRVSWGNGNSPSSLPMLRRSGPIREQGRGQRLVQHPLVAIKTKK